MRVLEHRYLSPDLGNCTKAWVLFGFHMLEVLGSIPSGATFIRSRVWYIAGRVLAPVSGSCPDLRRFDSGSRYFLEVKHRWRCRGLLTLRTGFDSLNLHAWQAVR